MNSKVIRTICLFKKDFDGTEAKKLQELSSKLEDKGYIIQTNRICAPKKFGEIEAQTNAENVLISVGEVSFDYAMDNLEKFYSSKDNFNVELANADLTLDHAKILFEIIKNAPSKTFNFTYVFNNAKSSPYMPSATYEQDGFSIGLQPTDLSEDANSLEEWFGNLEDAYNEIHNLFESESDFLGIDSSIAPLFEGNSSFVHFLNKIFPKGFSSTVTTDIYTRITRFIKERNPKIIGLSGLMLPCLEDFELTKEYEQGNFSLERNIFLSLHSGLGIDTYPIGIDESPEKVLEILELVQALSNKYKKPLSVRFVSDGKAKIGEKSDFQNQYLYDFVIRRL